MLSKFVALVEAANTKSDVPEFHVGDRIEVHQRLLDGAKERLQVFEGDVIARHNGGIRETVTVRRTVQGEGVERIFPLHSTRIAKIVVKKAGLVRRAKLYYLRDRVGKATKIKEDTKRQGGLDAAIVASAKESARLAQEAAKAAAASGGESKSAQKKKARKEAAAAKK